MCKMFNQYVRIPLEVKHRMTNIETARKCGKDISIYIKKIRISYKKKICVLLNLKLSQNRQKFKDFL